MLLFSGQPLAQGISGAVTVSPVNASADSLITITFDPRLDCEFGSLQSLVGEPVVKMHSGVTINGNSWSNIVWFDQPSATGYYPTMTLNADSTYSISFIPRWFYGVAPGVQIEAINCVFNNGTWNKEGKDYDYPGHCIDFYLPLQTLPSWNSVWHKTYNQHDATRRWIINMSMDRPDCAWGAARVQSGTQYPGFVRVMNNGLFRRSDLLYNYPGYRPVMIASAGPDSAWILAMNSGAQQIKVLNTTDGGWVWNVQADGLFDMGQGSYTNVIHFWNKMEGIIIGDPVNGSWDIFRTSDAGVTWTRLDTNNIPAPLASEVGVEMAYAAVGDTIFFSTSDGRMFKSTDRGLHWSAVTCPVTTKFTFANATEGWLLQSGTSNFFHTTDGGNNWNQINYTGTIGGFNIKHVPGTASTLVSSNGGAQGIYYSLDAGQSWSPANGPQFERVYGIGIYDVNHGWAGGYSDSLQNLPMFRLVTALTPVVGNVYYSKPLPCQGEYITAWPDILVPVNQWEWILPWSTQPHLSDMFPSFTSASPGPKDVQLRVHNTFGVYDFYFDRAITFREKPDFNLGTDTSLCIGQCIDLLPEIQKDLFFSEYIEGSGYNRALEIYNGTGVTVDMHDYAIWKNFNGSNWDGVYQFPLGTTLAQGDVLVVAHAQADSAILSVADIILTNTDYNFMMAYNGDDVRALVKYNNGDTIILDYIGSETLEDPGWNWRVGDVWGATNDHSLVRKPFVDNGQVFWDISAGVDNNTSEWEVNGLDDFSHLGWHQATDPYTYEWKDANIGSILDTTATLHFCQPNQHPSNLLLKLTDTWVCYRTDDISITPSIFYVDIAGESSICSGSCTQLTATAGTSYQWSTGDTTQSITACPQYGESYYVTVTNANGCTGTASHYVGTYNIIPVIQTTKDTLCGNESAILSAPGYVSYQWSTGDTTPTTEAWHPGNYNLYYYLTVTDTSGCSGNANISIWHLEKPNVIITGNDQINVGDCTFLYASGGHRYLWNTGATTPGINVCPQLTTSYSVQSWYMLGGTYSACRDTAWFTVDVLQPPVITLSPDTQVCAGGCATLIASGNGSLLWSTGDTNAQITVCPAQTQSYSVTLTAQGGATASGSILVTVIPEPQVGIMGVPGVCEGECTSLTAVGNGTYQWSTGDTSGEIQVCPIQSQFYALTLTDPNGCTNSDTFQITVWPSPVIQISGSNQITLGQCATLTASGGATYAWSTGAGSATAQLCPPADSSYTLTVYSAEGCESYDTVTISVSPQTQGYGLKAFLSGAYISNGLMRTNRSALPAFPLTQPYSMPPWNYSGNESIDSAHADLVDWVLVEYRAAADCTLISGREARLLWKDGTVTDHQGNSLMQAAAQGMNYIVLYHLNHLPVMTAYPVSLTSGATYDLSDTLACPLFGGGRRAAYQLGGGLAGLPVGDLNHDKRLKYSGPQNDRNIILTRINTQTGSTTLTTTTGGYFDEDLSMDGVVRYSGPGNDPSKIISNLIGLTGSTAITSIYVSPVPDGVFPPCTPQPDQANAGPDSLNMAGDSIVLYANVPLVGTGEWTVISGQGWVFSDSSIATSTFHGLAGETYILVWTISTVCGSTSDTLVIGFVAMQGFQCGDTLTDQRDGKTYPTISIGAQCWMGANLNVGTMVNSVYSGTPHSDASDNGIIEKYCYGNNAINCTVYGGLYDWNEAMDYGLAEGARGICPEGWHLPMDAEWKILEGMIDSQYGPGDPIWDSPAWRGLDAGGKLKESSTAHWYSPNTGATNGSGFTAIPGGYRDIRGNSFNVFYNADFWTSTAFGPDDAFRRRLGYASAQVNRESSGKAYGFSVRCIKDDTTLCTPQPDHANAGPDSLDIPGDSIVLYANVPLVGSGLWWVDSLSAGSFSDATLPNSVFYGQSGQTYQLVWAISTVCATITDTVVISFAAPSTFNCSGSFIDSRDGQSYPMVHIGNQCWMGRNLNTGQFTQSVASGWTSHSDMSNDGVIQKYCYVNDQIYCDIYGGLYEWDEMMGYLTNEGVQGICPTGWHLPSDAEWTVLTDYFGGLSLAGGHLKDASPNFWSYPNTDATNGSGFTALPGGRRYFSGSFSDLSDYGLFWSSTPSTSVPQYATIRSLGYQGGSINQYEGYKTYGLSVRCISDADPGPQPPVQANAGPDSLGIEDNYFVLYGNYPMNGTGLWTIVSGQGGSFADSSLFNSEFYGNYGETYALAWSITTPAGSSSDTVLIGFALVYPDCGMIYDFRDGRMYETVVIGSYCWMKENLNVGVRLDRTASASNDSVPEKYCYQDLEANCDIYGGLYSWNELTNYIGYNSYQGLCPEGWHVPEISEWQNLINGVANDGNALKEIGVGIPPLGEGTNLSGFSALLGGYLTGPGGNYEGLDLVGRFYTRSNPSSWPANYWVLHDTAAINGGSSSPGHAYSVRCVLDY
jgi:uncharacterized protein (TIGR02145 family)